MLFLHSTSSIFPSRSYFEKDDESAHNEDMDYEVDYDFGENRDRNDLIFENDTETAFRPLRRKTMSVTKFQVMLNDLLLKHKASLLLYDEIIEVFSMYINSPDFNRFDKFKSRKALLLSTQKSLHTQCLRPLNGTVRLHNNSLVTVPVFHAKHMIKSLLTDPSLMKESNFAEGYNVLTGEVQRGHPDNKKYGEIHTGDAWRPAMRRYCQNENDMPVALIIFADKTHTDLH